MGVRNWIFLVLMLGLTGCSEGSDNGTSPGQLEESTGSESPEGLTETPDEAVSIVEEGDEGLNFGDTPEAECVPKCEENTCDIDDGCGGVCACTDDSQVCSEEECCTPSCDGKSCGTDGCGGSCGSCEGGGTCFEGACCVPDCDGKECGNNGCGGMCGVCSAEVL